MKLLETRRRIVGKKAFIGARVFFVWSNIPFTGTITSISVRTFGIECDTDYHVTDVFCIPRLLKEIHIPKINCKITDEISPIIYEYYTDALSNKVSGGVEVAYYHLPKRSIYPWFGDKMKHIKFVPNKTIVKLDDGQYWYLIAYNTNTFNMATLISMKDYDTEYRIPDWKFQTHIHGGQGKKSKRVTELNIEKVYSIPDSKGYISANELLRTKRLNLMYDALSSENAPITHSFREHGDVNPEYLPKETYYDFNLHTK